MQVLPLHGYCVALIIMIVIWCSAVLDKASWTRFGVLRGPAVGDLFELFDYNLESLCLRL